MGLLEILGIIGLLAYGGNKVVGARSAAKRERKALGIQNWLTDLGMQTEKIATKRSTRETQDQIAQNLLQLQTTNLNQQQQEFQRQLLQAQMAVNQNRLQAVSQIAQQGAMGPPMQNVQDLASVPLTALMR